MARSAAELLGLHVLHSAIGNLGPDQNVENSRDSEKPGNTTQCRLAVERSFSQPLTNPALAEIDPDRNQNQASEENQWKNEEDDDSNVWVIDLAANLWRKDKEQRDESRSRGRTPYKTQPV